MKKLLLFILLSYSSIAFGQSPCAELDLKVNTPPTTNSSFEWLDIKDAFFDYQRCVQETNSDLFDKIKYFDLILKGDNGKFLALINDQYLLLDENYRIYKEINRMTGNIGVTMNVSPFRNGYAKLHEGTEALLDSFGNVVPNSSGERVISVKDGFFVQKGITVEYYWKGHLMKSWEGQLMREIQLSKTFIPIKYKGIYTILNEKGNNFCDTLLSYIPLGNKWLYVFNSLRQDVIYNSAGEVIFKSDKEAALESDIGIYGCITVKDGQKGYFDFLKNEFSPLENKDYYQISKDLLTWNEGEFCGLVTTSGKEICKAEYIPVSDFTYDYFYKDDGVYRLTENDMIKLPVSKSEWMKKRAIGNSIYVIKRDKYCLLNGETGQFLKQEFDTIYKNVLGDNVLTSKGSNSLKITQNERFLGFICEENGKFRLMDSTLSKSLSPVMDTIHAFGMQTYKFRVKDKWGYLSGTGKVICSPSYDEISKIGNYHYKVVQSGKTGIIDQNEKMIIPCEYDEVRQIHSYCFVTKKGNDKFLFDCYGKQLIQEPISYARVFYREGKLICDYKTLSESKSMVLLE